VQIGDVVSDNITAEIIRTLYGTGFFNDVTVEREGDMLVVAVRERPAVAEITLVGNKSLDTEVLKQGLPRSGWPRGASLIHRFSIASSRNCSGSTSVRASTASASSPPSRRWSATALRCASRSTRG
jgi:outer membrane protein assembly factor BamA